MTEALRDKNLDELNKQFSSLNIMPECANHDPKVVTLQEFLGMELPQRSFVIEPWLPTQGLTMIYASRGVGKTYLALSIGYCIASGNSLLNWNVTQPRGVLYVDGEMPCFTIQERLSHIVKSFPKEASKQFKIYTPDLQKMGMPDLSTQEGQSVIESYLDDVDVIIIDNISTLCRSGKENEAEAWLPVQQWALRMRGLSKSVLFIHHAGKNGKQRGTSRREDVMDSVLCLEHPNDYNPEDGAVFELHFKKSRGFHGQEAAPLLVKLTNSDSGNIIWEHSALEDSLHAQIISMYKDDMKQIEIAKELDVHRSTISRCIKHAKDEGKL